MGLSGLENAAVSISRMHEMASLSREKDSATGTSDSATVSDEAASLTFKAVHMRYRADLPDVVRNVSFDALAGTKIGICGRSGSGKSSLILAIFRGLDQSLVRGQVLVNSVDIQSIPLETLRESLSLVAQQPVIWYASVRENLDPRSEHTDQEIWATLSRTGLEEAITNLPSKLETVLDNEGSLSTGQRQLLCIARILLRKKKIVILDEASSSLDIETDKKIRDIIRSELADCTVISIAHRIATIMNFDMILVMENGIIVENGPPAVLLSQPDSKFAQLAASQGLRGATSETVDE
ncbi:multidrug resistance-associated protein 1-like protein [Mycena belliarum]|uniref:Multidrug resistance-associated protein 1-like protein n=1 Tax=Mycena belliarum TaxID=1033014 RepID=A0AAD6U9F9_9AGAR|nr:multidrug resistance-associated protein 1-like protein [Mycena belliae]